MLGYQGLLRCATRKKRISQRSKRNKIVQLHRVTANYKVNLVIPNTHYFQKGLNHLKATQNQNRTYHTETIFLSKMEKGLLDKEGEESLSLTRISSWRSVYVEEVKKVACIAGPLVAVNLSQYFLQIIAVMMVGHLGELYLSSTAIAISFCAVTGFSLVVSL